MDIDNIDYKDNPNFKIIKYVEDIDDADKMTLFKQDVNSLLNNDSCVLVVSKDMTKGVLYRAPSVTGSDKIEDALGYKFLMLYFWIIETPERRAILELMWNKFNNTNTDDNTVQ